MVVQTRRCKKSNKSIIFESTDDDDTDYIPSNESECEEEYESTESESSIEETEIETEEDDDEEIEGINFDLASKIIKPLLKNKYKIFDSKDFNKYLQKVSELDPEIETILNSPNVKDKYKIQLCELYLILIGQENFSMEWIDIRNLLKQEIKRIERKTCIFDNVDKVNLAIKLSEFKSAKKVMNIPLKEQIILLDAPIETKSILYNKYKELQEYNHTDSDEYTKNYSWLQNALQIPFNNIKTLNTENICLFLSNVYEKLNQEFYGMQKVKEQILLYINMKLTNPNAKGYNLALLGDRGVGKCFAVNTPILMYDGSVKNVQDVQLHDQLIGPSNTKVYVKQLITSMDTMYTIQQPWSDNYKVCHGHLLTLQCIKNIPKIYTYLYNVKSYKVGDVLHIPVETFYSYSKNLQKKFSSLQVPVEFNNGIDIDIPFYLLGMWYGGCDPNTVDFIIMKNENVFNIFKLYCKKYHSLFSIIYKTETLMDISLESKHSNSFKNILKALNLWGRYKIPLNFKHMTFNQKLQFIAGFIDVNGVVEYNFNIITSLVMGGDEQYVNDLIFLIRSVGLYCQKHGKHSIRIFGKSEILQQIPSMIYTGKYNSELFKHHTISIVKEQIEQYYGFEVEGDSEHLFLLGDCTVVHNCFGVNTMIRLFNGKVKPVQYIQPGDILMGDDNKQRIVDSTTSGNEIMYDVHQEYGDLYTVNESHILSLCLVKSHLLPNGKTRVFSINDDNIITFTDIDTTSNVSSELLYIDITVTEYLEYNDDIKPFLIGYKRGFEIEHSQLSNNHMFTIGLLYNYKKYIYVPNTYISLIDKISISNYYKKCKSETNYTIYEKIVDNLHIDINIHEILLTTKERQHQFLAGLLISAIIVDDDDNLIIKHSMDYEKIYNIIGVKNNLTVENISSLFYNVFKSYPILYNIRLVRKDIGKYYGFTLSDTSPNRRFLLHDGTVVHNTHISRTLANILDFPFEQISMGNVTNSEILTGHQSTYIGSKPGIIASSLMKMKYKNGIIFLDEFDKIKNAEISNSMLHIVDSTQNSTFSDNYFGQELKIDLSNIWFVFAMNEIPECGPLKDRLFIIHIDGYKHKDKIEITRNYLLKRVCINVGLKETDVVMDNDVTSYFINKITIGENKTNTGVRYIEKALTDFINKIVFIVNTVSTFGDLSFSVQEKLEYPVTITHKLIDKILVHDNEPVVNMMYI
jgi:ATP-dependent Lon protease